MDEMRTLQQKTNPAFEFCEAACWMAFRGTEMIGRIAGIINHKANKRWNEQLVRFGWIEFIDDPEVSSLLIRTVNEWGKSKGMNGIHGPLGFSDMDHEGMLLEGFDKPGTLSSIYNYAYYQEHMERLGFVRAADWVQFEFDIPPIPEKIERANQLVAERYGLRILEVKKARELLPYARKMFNMLNVAYDNLYGYSSLSERQMDAYTKQYFGFIRPEFVSLVVDHQDDIVGFGISMPSLTKALQRCKGKLFPFGFLHILKAIRKNDIIDLYLFGVHPKYQGKGVTALFFYHLHKAYLAHGMKKAISSPQLEDNTKSLIMWKSFPHRQIMRRRVWIRHDL
jgi:GNAT superfamily N-acetyltransferase